jgi:hypothetical protein
MDAALLLVTWIIYGQAPSSYQTPFASMEACEAARQAVLRDADRVRVERQVYDDRARRQPGTVVYNAPPPPIVSAVCAARESSANLVPSSQPAPVQNAQASPPGFNPLSPEVLRILNSLPDTTDSKRVPDPLAEAGFNSTEPRRWYHGNQTVTFEELSALAEQGDIEAQETLGTAYANDPPPTHYGKAFYWWRKAADAGSVKAQLALGIRYGTGDGVERNSTEAMRWLRMADAHGDPAGAKWIGWFYERGWFASHATGSAQAPAAAKADPYANIAAQWGLAPSGPDYVEAAKWYRRAAERGDGDAQWALGDFYTQGQGVTRDVDEARRWYAAAAAQGYKGAKEALERLTNSRQ